MSRENKDYMLTPYGLIKEFGYDNMAWQARERYMSHFFEHQNFIGNIFIYENLPETVEENFLEMYLTSNGTVGWTKWNDKLVVIRGGRSEDIGLYGLAKYYLGTCNDPEMGSISFKDGEDGVIGYNNSSMSPDFDFTFYPYILTEIEKSIIFNIKYSRLAPIFEATDSKDKAAIEELLNNIDDGKVVNVISQDILEQLEDGVGTKTHNLTDVKEIDKLQYLIKAYEDILRIFHTKYGLAERGSGKMAQQTVDEVNGSTSSAFTLVLNMLYYRRKMVEEVNNMFDTNIIVKFSPAWELEYQKFILDSTNEDSEFAQDKIEDETEDPTEDETEDPTEDETEDPTEDPTAGAEGEEGEKKEGEKSEE